MSPKLSDSKPKVLFVGSGKLGIPSLAKIAASPELEFLGAITQNDKPAGRKLHLTPTPVAEFARKNNIPLKKIKSINAPEFIGYARLLSPDFIFLASFGQILKDEILKTPRIEPLNLHGSLLPKFRGAAPIQAVILDGELETGVSFMRMDKGLDTGAVFAKFATKISHTDNTPILEDKLAILAAEHAVEVIINIFYGRISAQEQEHDKVSYAKKIEKHHGLINWNEDAEIIERKTRAFYPWPSAYTQMQIFGTDYRFKIVRAEVVPSIASAPGTFIITKDSFIVACGKNALKLLCIHPDGRKEMSINEFIHRFHKHL